MSKEILENNNNNANGGEPPLTSSIRSFWLQLDREAARSSPRSSVVLSANPLVKRHDSRDVLPPQQQGNSTLATNNQSNITSQSTLNVSSSNASNSKESMSNINQPSKLTVIF